jgi:DNA-binding transcriptional LysR family regulator
LNIGVAREVPLLIRQLEYLVALAHEKYFAHAAERCDISQPALSLALRQLESELGVAIVERGNGFRGFTQEGEIVLKWSRRVLADEETLKQELRLRSTSLSGRLRLGVIPSATSTSSLLSTSFVCENPGVSISDVEMTSTDILRALMSFELDAGITYIDNEPLGHVRTHAIGKEEYVLVTPADSPLAGRPTVTWTEVAALPLCLLHRDMQNRRTIETIFESVGARPNPRIETNSNDKQILLPARRLLVDHYAAKFRRVAGASGGAARRTDHRAQCRQDGRPGYRRPVAHSAAAAGFLGTRRARIALGSLGGYRRNPDIGARERRRFAVTAAGGVRLWVKENSGSLHDGGKQPQCEFRLVP